ncbi:MAG: LacI family transcriptional regulator, repressor for deo operon, udp, cdd, tsx, nupC, and nupG [Pseudonocardiales bacterium]|jgi:LacI family repressor for deo operon, udp, cdd, tsx, nupC, and nupG|nr:LacI family transcriptional regulator, repressor for deo operon, udp, cdd, tsx, nupC, and nupG [Pseudonocardiales bacterium]
MVASIEDVARRAGVSIATVSRALRGLPDVAAATRDRVLTAAADLNYIASPFAARLASGRTATVGVVVPFVNRWFFAEVIDTVEMALRRTGFDLLLYNLGDEDGRARFFEVMPMRKRVDGVLIISLVLSDDEFEALGSLGTPVGLLGLERPGFVSSSIDDVASARAAVEHLLELGHRRIGLIGGDTDDPMRFTPPLHRRDGYRDALTAADVELDPDLEVLGYFTVDGGSEAMHRLLEVSDRPTAVFAESDEMAYGALRTIRRAGLRVPQDVALVGFDDQANAEMMDLSTMRQPVAEQALDVTTRLLSVIGEPTQAVRAVVLPTELVVRGSTDASRSVY